MVAAAFFTLLVAGLVPTSLLVMVTARPSQLGNIITAIRTAFAVVHAQRRQAVAAPPRLPVSQTSFAPSIVGATIHIRGSGRKALPEQPQIRLKAATQGGADLHRRPGRRLWRCEVLHAIEFCSGGSNSGSSSIGSWAGDADGSCKDECSGEAEQPESRAAPYFAALTKK
jgi:hypothetical protein